MSGSTGTRDDDQATPAGLLESWKEIAAYFRRGVRTVRRWEKEEGLPVHRQVHKKLGTVYAHTSELDAWRRGRSAAITPAPGPVLNRARSNRTASTRVMISVLPFENLSGDSEQEYIADGLTEEMISQLGRLNPATLGVIARTTVMQYKGTSRTVRQIAEELRVDYVLEGSVRREGGRIRVTGQLIDVLDQAHVWSGTYDHAVHSVMALQRELAGDIGRDCIALQGYAHARAGSTREALKQLERLRRLARRRYVPAFLFANVYLGLGDQEKALRFIEQEYDARGWYLLLIRQAPQFDPLRSHPRFKALLSRMNFPG